MRFSFMITRNQDRQSLGVVLHDVIERASRHPHSLACFDHGHAIDHVLDDLKGGVHAGSFGEGFHGSILPSRSQCHSAAQKWVVGVVVLVNGRVENALYDWLTIRGDSPGPLFTSLSDRSNGGRLLSLRELGALVKGYFRAAGIRGNKTIHSLRHTAIIKAILGGAPKQQVKSMTRH
jgi:hypothetical protein